MLNRRQRQMCIRDRPLPIEMQPASDDGLGWILEVESRDPESDRLRLVAASTGSLYYGDASMKFTLRNR